MKRSARLTQVQKDELARHIKKCEDAKEIRRAQAVLLIDSNSGYAVIESLTAYKERAALALRRRFLERGLEGIENKRRGRPKSLLTKAQRDEIINLLTKTSPKDHNIEADYWSTTILGHVVKDKYNVVYKSKKPYYLLFEEAKFSFHKPGQVYEKRDEARVEVWREEIRPVLEKAFSHKETVILCGDEMVLSSQTTFQKIWLKKGEYPKIEVSNVKKNKSLYGFLNIKTGQEHAFVKDWQNMYITVEVLQELRKIYPTEKMLLLWDGAGWHKGSEVVNFMAQDGHMQAMYFPPYSPEENPQEHVWKAGRSSITHNQYIPDITKAANDFTNHLNKTLFHYKLLHFAAHS